MWTLLRTFSWQELRHHPWRSAAAVVAVMLGVALAFAVQLINSSALDEFAQAVRSVNGQPDLEVRAMQGALDEALYTPLATHPQVRQASPVLELTAMARSASSSERSTSAARGCFCWQFWPACAVAANRAAVAAAISRRLIA